MQKLLIFLSIGLIFVWIQNTNGTPIHGFLSQSDEDLDIPTKIFPESKWILDSDENSAESDETSIEHKPVSVEVKENDQSSEEKEKIEQALELTREFENPSRQNIEQDNGNDVDDDDNTYLNIANIVDNNQHKFVEDDDD